jgi:hypothetical protein
MIQLRHTDTLAIKVLPAIFAKSHNFNRFPEKLTATVILNAA